MPRSPKLRTAAPEWNCEIGSNLSTTMDTEKKDYAERVEKAVIGAMSDEKYWARRRWHWEEWGSPVGLSLGWALFVVSTGFTLYLLHLAGIIG